MRTIRKKIASEYFDAVEDGRKTFELRKDEDNIQVGDVLKLSEWDGKDYTGRYVYRVVSYVLRGYDGLKEGYAIYGIIPVRGERKDGDGE